MARSVHQVQLIGLAILGFIGQADRLRLDRNAPFALNIHGIEHLFLELARRHAATYLYQPISQSRFAVINMGNNREVTNVG